VILVASGVIFPLFQTVLKEVMGFKMPIIGKRRKREYPAPGDGVVSAGDSPSNGAHPSTEQGEMRMSRKQVPALPGIWSDEEDAGDRRWMGGVILPPTLPLTSDNSLVNETLALLEPALVSRTGAWILFTPQFYPLSMDVKTEKKS
jgi:hypothetical protein